MNLTINGAPGDVQAFVKFEGTVAELIEVAKSLKSSAIPVNLTAFNAAIEAKRIEAYHEIAASGGIIAAIKLRRTHTECSLKEAKDYIEELLASRVGGAGDNT